MARMMPVTSSDSRPIEIHISKYYVYLDENHSFENVKHSSVILQAYL